MSEARNDKKNISNHILPTSSNLLGLCFVILTFMKILKVGHETLIDEIVAAAIVLFFTSSFYFQFLLLCIHALRQVHAIM